MRISYLGTCSFVYMICLQWMSTGSFIYVICFQWMSSSAMYMFVTLKFVRDIFTWCVCVCISCSVRSGQLKNVQSARVSVPGQVIKYATTSLKVCVIIFCCMCGASCLVRCPSSGVKITHLIFETTNEVSFQVSVTSHMTCYQHENKVCAEQTRQVADSCFDLIGPHQCCVCLAAPLRPTLTNLRQA